MVKYSKFIFGCGLCVVDQIQWDLLELIVFELKDLWVGMIIIIEVQVILDYVYVKVFFIMLVDNFDVIKNMLVGLCKVGGYLCIQLGCRLIIYILLELYFVYDNLIVCGIEMLCLIDEVNVICVKDLDDEV